MKVYVVMWEDYEDSCVEEVFSSLEKADKYLTQLGYKKDSQDKSSGKVYYIKACGDGTHYTSYSIKEFEVSK